jgi:hypothetical protein
MSVDLLFHVELRLLSSIVEEDKLFYPREELGPLLAGDLSSSSHTNCRPDAGISPGTSKPGPTTSGQDRDICLEQNVSGD